MSAAELRPGDRVGRLVVLRELGRGASGVVLEAYDPRLDRNVALKLLQDVLDPEREERASKRLVKEAQAMAQLSHPNVVAVHDVTTAKLEGSAHVLVEMEYVPGSTLEQWLAERAADAWREVLEVLLEAGEGLAAAHTRGLVHRDFKPANVLIDESGRAKITDFGLVRRADEAEPEVATPASSPTALDVPLTATGTLLGTPAYMAPELFGGEPADARSDQFAYCVTLYEALYGQRPFAGETLAALAEATAEGVPIRPSSDRRVPSFVHQAIVRGLQPDPRQRHESVQALLTALRADPWRTPRRIGLVAAVAIGLRGAASGVAPYFEPGTLALTFDYSAEPPASVVVEIDGTPTELVDRGARVKLASGFHRLRIVAPEYEPLTRRFWVGAGQTVPLEAELQHEQGTVELRTFPRGASLVIGDRELGSSLDELPVDTGPRTLRVALPGRHVARLRVDLDAADSVALTAHLSDAVMFERFDAGLSMGRGRLRDVDGDGRTDLWYRNYGQVIALSPWSGEHLWTREVSKNANAAFSMMVDLDDDGVLDPVVLGTDDQGAVLHAFSGMGRAVGALPWTFEPDEDRRDAPLVPPVFVRGEAGALVVATSLQTGTVTAIDAKSGDERWTGTVAPPVFGLVASGESPRPWVAVAHGGGVSMFDADSDLETNDARWFHPIGTFDQSLVDGLNHRNRLQHVGRASHGSWMIAAPLDDRLGDDLVIVAATDAGGGPLLGLSSDDKSKLLTGPRVHPLRVEDLGDLDSDGATDFKVELSKPNQTEVHVDPTRPLVRAVLSGRDARVLHTLEAAQRVGRWPCGGEPAVIQYERPAFVARRIGSDEPLEPFPELDHVVNVICTDWNGDGTDDMVVSTHRHGLRAYASTDDGLVELGAIALERRINDVVPLGDVDGDAMPDFLLAAKGPTVVAGSRVRWGRSYGSRIRVEPVVVDLDGDGRQETVVFTGEESNDHLQVLAALDGRRLEAFPNSGPGIRPPTVVDGATFGSHDVVFAHNLSVWRLHGAQLSLHELEVDEPLETYAEIGTEGRGDELWLTSDDVAPHLRALSKFEGGARWTTREVLSGRASSRAGPQLAPLDEDPSQEVVAVLDGGRLVVVDVADGTCQWSRWVHAEVARWPPTLVDLDGDGRREVVTSVAEDAPTTGSSCEETAGRPQPSSTPDLVALDGRDGSILWHRSGAGLGVAPAVVTRGDERWLMGVANGLYSVALDGTTRGAWDPALRSRHPLRVGDLNGDGWPDLLLVDQTGALVVFDAVTGTQQWSWFDPEAGPVSAPPTIADIDVPPDGRDEILLSTTDGFVFALDGMFVRR